MISIALLFSHTLRKIRRKAVIGIKSYLILMLAVASMIGCSNKTGLLNSATTVASEQNLADLNSLMAAHPEFSKASLKDIKVAAMGTSETNNVLDIKFATDTNMGGPLDKEVAKKAQGLIDTILDEFNLEAQLNAEFKILGIVMNWQRDVEEKMAKNDFFNSKTSSPNDFMDVKKSLGTEKDNIKLLTCEQAIEKPFGEMPKEKLMQIIKRAQDELKSTLSGCSKIQGQPFVQCMEYFNKMAGLVNKHANCNMRNFDDLTKIAEKEFNMKFTDIQHASKDCLYSQFSKCGFSINKKEENKPETPAVQVQQ